MSRINRYFFEPTNALHDEIVSLYDFILPAATAIWQFRNIVQDAYKNEPSLKVQELSKKYNTAPGTRKTTNLKTPFMEHSWEAQRERLAEITLVNLIALYEVWCDEICELFNRSDLTIKLQFPSSNSNGDGVLFAMAELKAAHSPRMANSFYADLTSSKKYSLGRLNSLLKCFRYFKELRNCFMHRGRKCDSRLFGWQSQFVPVASNKHLGMDFVPTFRSAQIGDKIQLDLHGSLGFTDVILRIISTLDAELCATVVGERSLISRIKMQTTSPINERKLKQMLYTMGLDGTTISPDLAQLMIERGILAI